MAAMTGTRLGRWIVGEKIGHGAMGEVYRAHLAERPDERVAVKMLSAELARDPVFVMRFQSEIEILRQLDHARIVKFLDSGIHETIPYFVMEYVDGRDYEAILRSLEPRRLPWQEAFDLCLQVVPALQHAHRRGVIHRDLKPSNILRGRNGEVKLSDFGVAKMFAQQSTGSGAQLASPIGSVVGAIAYTAPEQALGKPLTKRSDFYALGGVLYTLITGRPPFVGNNVIEVMHKHCFATVERPSHFVPGLPKEFEDLILRLLSKDPAMRPSDGSVIIKDLLRIRGELERRGLIAPLPADQKVAVLAPLVASRDLDDDEDDISTESPIVPSTPLMSRPIVVIPLALIVFAALIWGVLSMFSKPSPESLFAPAEPLLASENPDDWEKAWHDHLAELAERYPGYRTNELKRIKQQVDALTAIRRSIATGQLATAPTSEAERSFRRGLMLCQMGEYRAARQAWQELTQAFDDVELAQTWVIGAKRGIARINELLAEKPGLR